MTDSLMSLNKVTNDSSASLDAMSCSSNILVTLRRMKIEENSLAKDINKSLNYHENEEYQGINNNNNLECKKYSSDFKSSLIVIKNLYEEVRANTTSEDNLQILDIDDVKKDVLNLENKIKTMKAYLQSELSLLKKKEQDLVHDVCEKVSNCNKMNRRKRLPKPKCNEVVLSPVKVLINSPFKCPEVQQFQNFMKVSRNRYGGWNAYHHNIFEQAWLKYFGTDTDDKTADEDCDFDYWEEKQKSHEYHLFLQELFRKIPGILMEDFIEHYKWYTKYIILKNRQQKALDRWRAKKKLIKKHRRSSPGSHRSGQVSKLSIDRMDTDVINSVVSDENKEMEKTYLLYDGKNSESASLVNNSGELKDKPSVIPDTTKSHRLRYLQHTAQWRSRCNSWSDTSDTSNTNCNIEDILRLGVPVWRSCLRENP